MFCVLICTVQLTVYSYHVSYAFQSESALYSWLYVKELLPRSKHVIWSLSDYNWTPTQTTLFVNEHTTIWPNWPYDWAVFWVLICTVQLTVCSYHVLYAFQSESILYSCLYVKELLARNKHVIWSLSDCNWIWTQNHLVRKATHNHLAKLTLWLRCVLSTYLYGAIDCMFLPCLVRVSEWIHTL